MAPEGIAAALWDFDVFIYFYSPLFNQVGQLRTRSQLHLRPGQDKGKQCDKNNTELHINKRTVNNTKPMYSVQCVPMLKSRGKSINRRNNYNLALTLE